MVDILDRRGRLQRLFVAVVVGLTVAFLLGGALYGVVDPDHQASDGGWRFVGGMTGLGAVIAGTATLALLERRARRREEAERIPRARVVE